MITLSEIDQLIKNPALVNQTMLDDLRVLSDKYPYTQVFSILYLKGLKNTGDIHFDDELTKHSYRITDRVQLFNLIQGTSYSSEAALEQEVVTESHTETPVQEEQISEPSTETKETIEPTITPTEEATGVDQIEKEEPTIEEESTTITSSDALEENILHHALTNTYQLEELSEEEEEELEIRQAEKEPEIEEELETVNNIEEPQEIRNVDRDSTHSFTEWLKANNHYEEDDDKDREHIKQIVTNFENFDPSDDLFGEVEKPKAEFFSPTKKAKESLDDSSVPVSETLAKIYALQGNYPKAIEAYEQLSLINPEKKIFFADRIKELKKKIHTK